jgi:hypothetical protein
MYTITDYNSFLCSYKCVILVLTYYHTVMACMKIILFFSQSTYVIICIVVIANRLLFSEHAILLISDETVRQIRSSSGSNKYALKVPNILIYEYNMVRYIYIYEYIYVCTHILYTHVYICKCTQMHIYVHINLYIYVIPFYLSFSHLTLQNT